jgi:flagellar M-ring protein FliF
LAQFFTNWRGVEGRARTGLVAGLILIAALVGALAYWAYRPDYQVLFADMAPRDTAAMVAELDKLKAPYQLGAGGNTILVPRDQVYKLRLKLMGKEVPLHGAVGFEVFNNADFGMTEFVQKVNYQRAVQGELTRTIQAIDAIAAARVHLAIPEQGLFKKASAKAKASVALTVKPGQVLTPEQVSGIQRLVAASVPDIAAADVTVLDQHGTALTRVASFDGAVDGAGSGGQLDAKRSTEDYLAKKIGQVLDRTFGAGEAIATVDVLLNLDQSKVTTEDVLPAHGRGENPSTGVVLHERHTIHDADTGPVNGAAAVNKLAANGGSTVSEADYQVGRRIEQLVVASGSVRRMTVAVVVRQALTDSQVDKLREVLGLAVGFSAARGDAIVVSSMDRLSTQVAQPDAAVSAADVPAAVPRAASAPTARVTWILGTLLALAALVGLVALVLRLRRAPKSAVVVLDAEQQARLLADVRAWIATPATVTAVRK